jgi:hypothetical protein
VRSFQGRALAAVDWLEWWTAGRVVAAAAVAQLVVVGWAALYARGQVREARTLREGVGGGDKGAGVL